MAEVRSSTREDLEFDGQAMTIFEDGVCWLVALDDWEIAVILSSLRYAHWQKRWRNLGGHTWDEIEASISQLEHCLMAGCNVGELLDKFDNLTTVLETLSSRFITNELRNLAQVTEGVESAIEGLELSCGDTTVNFDTAAIVDAIEALDLTCGDTEVNFDTAAMVDAIEAQTTMQETRSIAEVTAQNTNFSDLVEAVDGLELVANCAPDVNLTCSPDVIVSGGGGGETGTTMPHDPGTIGDDPPDGYEPYVDDLACDLANALVDDLVIALQMFIDGGILWTIKVGGWVTAAGLLLASIFASTAIIILGISLKSILGKLSDVITQLVELEDSDLTELINILTENEEEFVCILYNGQNGDSVTDIKDAFNQALLDHEANDAQRALIDAFLCIDTLNMLYWQPTWYEGADIATRLDGYEGSVECGVCGEIPCYYENLFDTDPEYVFTDDRNLYGCADWRPERPVTAHGWDETEGALYVTVDPINPQYQGGYFNVTEGIGYVMGDGDTYTTTIHHTGGNAAGYLFILFTDNTCEWVSTANGNATIYGVNHIGKEIAAVRLAVFSGNTQTTIYFEKISLDLCVNA